MNIFTNMLNVNIKKNIGLHGMTDEFFCVYIYNLFLKSEENILIVTPTLYEANNITNSLYTYTNKVLLFPMDDFLTAEAVAISPELKTTRLETLKILSIAKEHYIVVTHLNAHLRYLPTKETYLKWTLNIITGTTHDRDTIISDLIKMGYTRTPLCNTTGEFAVRGFIIDIFPISATHPIRIEFFDDNIDSIREFDETTQKSIGELLDATIYPNTEYLLDTNMESEHEFQKYLKTDSTSITNIYGYLDNPYVFYKDYSQIETAYIKLQEDIVEYRNNKDKTFKDKYMFELEDFSNIECSYYNTIDNYFPYIQKNDIINFGVKKLESFHENIKLINKYLLDWVVQGKTVVLCLKDHQIKNIIKYLENEYVITDEFHIYENNVNIIDKSLFSGFIYDRYVFITEKELYNTITNKAKYKTAFKYATKIRDINHLSTGDYIVHNIHGIGVYNGIKTLGSDIKKDYLEILYAGKDKIYIPVEKISLISKYSGKEGVAPKIHKLDSSEWEKTKQRVKASVQNIANDLIKLYASREASKGFSFSKDSELQESFEKEFAYSATPDQLSAIEQIKKDMESAMPMDRLLCGDVGYGKTEVAFRAMFKAANDFKQVLYLCPTTILSTQQYENAKERFKNYPVSIEVLNRFTSSKEEKRIVAAIESGAADIVFGTHRILSDDIKPKNLGLLIIDEEQRFGVVHKEKIKTYKENVDVLTLTATPIPRTLQMSLVGLRSLSLIETPPVNRYPVQTYVTEENSQIIRDAIYKELSRNGQVYILYNNVVDLERKVNDISALVPEARTISAHGQLNKIDLENRMLKFINHEYDILVCTTIIETGIDIPNVNTLIILNSDYFGLSQLYQIRGRVGRSDRIAYAYLMYDKRRTLTETAVKRLNVIKEFTELGSGFAIATRDLSIRGAGNILGSEQAGFIDSIGIDLYLKILNEEVRRMKGEEIPEEEADERPLLEVDTHIEDKYVEEADLKIEIHQKINEIDSYEKLEIVKEELEDRFGNVNDKILVYMYEEWFEKLAQKVGIEKVIQTKNSVEVYFNEDISEKIDGEKLFMSAYQISRMFRFQYKNKHLVVILDTIKLEKHYIYYLIDLLKTIEI